MCRAFARDVLRAFIPERPDVDALQEVLAGTKQDGPDRQMQIVNQPGLTDAEGDNYVIRDGIVVIPQETVVPDGTVI